MNGSVATQPPSGVVLVGCASPDRPPSSPLSFPVLDCPHPPHTQWFSREASAQATTTSRYLSVLCSTGCVDSRSVRLGRVVMFLVTTTCAALVDRVLVQWAVSCGVAARGCVRVSTSAFPPTLNSRVLSVPKPTVLRAYQVLSKLTEPV